MPFSLGHDHLRFSPGDDQLSSKSPPALASGISLAMLWHLQKEDTWSEPQVPVDSFKRCPHLLVPGTKRIVLHTTVKTATDRKAVIPAVPCSLSLFSP